MDLSRRTQRLTLLHCAQPPLADDPIQFMSPRLSTVGNKLRYRVFLADGVHNPIITISSLAGLLP